jgi:two-component system chemotaxis response regulator CheB
MTYGPRVIGVLLTGRLDDGVAGLGVVKERGGLTVVQDPRDALYSDMPSKALRQVGADFKVPLADLPQLLARLAGEPVEAEPGPPVSRLAETESRFDHMEMATMENLDAIGVRAGLTCPECNGPLWKVDDPSIVRYRCLVGHGYTARSMLEAQRQAQEVYLWQALRLMKERASLLFELRARAEDAELPSEAAPFARQLAELAQDIPVIQEMLERDGASPEGAPPSAG